MRYFGAAIHQRVKKLEDAGVIRGSRLEVNPKALGYDVCAIIGIRVSDPTKNMLTVEKLRQVPEITECHFITGKYNILVKLYCTDNEHLMHTIFDHILQLPEVSQTRRSSRSASRSVVRSRYLTWETSRLWPLSV